MIAFSSSDYFPKDGVVEVVDVAIDLPPSKIVFEASLVRINNDSAIKSWYFFKFNIKIVFPIENIGRSKGRDDTA